MQFSAFGSRAAAAISLIILVAIALVTPLLQMTNLLPPYASSMRQIGYVIAFVISMFSLKSFRLKHIIQIVPWPLALLFLWCWFSIAWSEMPSVALRRLLLTTSIALTIMASVSRLGYRYTVTIVRSLLALMLALNLFFVFAYPEIGRETYHQGIVWRGILADKNIAGTFCALNAIIFLFSAKSIPQVLRWGVILLSTVFLFMTYSKTAWIGFFISIAFGWIVLHSHLVANFWPRGKSSSALRMMGGALALSVCLALIGVTVQGDFLISLTNDESIFTKRGAIWRAMLQTYLDHPLSGVGFGSYWQDTTIDANAFGGRNWLSNVDQGHNGYLDIAVQMGLLGLLLTLWTFIAWPAQSLLKSMLPQPRQSALISAVLIYCIVNNFTETSLLARDTLGNVFILLMLGLTLRLAKNVRAAPTARQSRRRKDNVLSSAG